MIKRIGEKARFIGVLAFLALFANPLTSFAYRPFTTEDAGVAGKGVAQLEASWDYAHWESGDADHTFLLVPIYGVTERLEMSLELPYIIHKPAEESSIQGLGDINVVGKYQLFEGTDVWPMFAIKGAIKTSSGSSTKGLGTGDLDYSLVAVASKELGPFTFHTMFGYTFVGDNGESNVQDVYVYGFAVDYALTEAFHLVSEVTGNRNSDTEAADDPVSSLIGATYKISEKVTVDGGMRFGCNDAAPDWNSTVGVTITF